MTPEAASPPAVAQRFAGALAVFVGGMDLVGWALDIAVLRSIVPSWVAMRPNTGLAFLLAGLALLLPAPRLANRAARARPALAARLAPLCALLAGLIGLLTLAEYLFGWQLGIDSWLIPEAQRTAGSAHPDRMAPDTALCLVILATATGLAVGRSLAKGRSVAVVVLGALVATVALAALVAYATPALRTQGWWGLRMMSPLSSTLFALLGTTLAVASWRHAVGPRLTPFSRHLWRLVAGVATLGLAFALDVRSEREIARVHEMRHRSFLLADELRQTIEDLNRVARTYVVTGDPVYKRQFEDILDIRDGRKPRPDDYWRPYWDLILEDAPSPHATRPASSLLDLMREAGFTEGEFRALAEASAASDHLTRLELQAMQMVESAGPEADARWAQARAMMYDLEFHQARVAVMRPIHDFLVLLDERTLAAVHAAGHSAVFFRYMIALSGIGLTFLLWRAYVALVGNLGGTVDEVSAHIARIGRGDFSSPIPVPADRANSVLGWLAETQAKLADLDQEHRQAERAQRTAAAYARSLLEASLDPLVTISAEGKITDVNEASVQVTGVPGEELIETDFSDYFTDPERARAGYRRVFAEGSVRDYPLAIQHVAGPVTDVMYNASLYRDERGNVRGVFAAARDITERKRAEEALRTLNAELEQRVHDRTAELEAANKELEAFSYSVSHDLRAPLRAIDGFGRILVEDYAGSLDAEGRRVLDVISSETRRMGQLVDDLLGFSRLGRQKLESARIDMTALAKAVFDEQAAQAPHRTLRLDLQSLPPAAGDPAMIRVVMSNLVANAVKFSRDRDPAVIEIGSRQVDAQTVYYVKDNGVGFDMSYVHKLFGVFQRLHSSEEFEGTGVGLALVQRVILRHGGRVWAEGKVGEGATLSFTLPNRSEKP